MLYTLEEYPMRTSMSTAKMNRILVTVDLNVACLWFHTIIYLLPMGVKFLSKVKKNYTTALKWFDFMHNNFITAEEQATSHAKELNICMCHTNEKKKRNNNRNIET